VLLEYQSSARRSIPNNDFGRSNFFRVWPAQLRAFLLRGALQQEKTVGRRRRRTTAAAHCKSKNLDPPFLFFSSSSPCCLSLNRSASIYNNNIIFHIANGRLCSKESNGFFGSRQTRTTPTRHPATPTHPHTQQSITSSGAQRLQYFARCLL